MAAAIVLTQSCCWQSHVYHVAQTLYYNNYFKWCKKKSSCASIPHMPTIIRQHILSFAFNTGPESFVSICSPSRSSIIVFICRQHIFAFTTGPESFVSICSSILAMTAPHLRPILLTSCLMFVMPAVWGVALSSIKMNPHQLQLHSGQQLDEVPGYCSINTTSQNNKILFPASLIPPYTINFTPRNCSPWIQSSSNSSPASLHTQILPSVTFIMPMQAYCTFISKKAFWTNDNDSISCSPLWTLDANPCKTAGVSIILSSFWSVSQHLCGRLLTVWIQICPAGCPFCGLCSLFVAQKHKTEIEKNINQLTNTINENKFDKMIK